MSFINNPPNITETFIIEPLDVDSIYTTGATLIGNIIYFDRTDALSAYTANLSSLVTTDTYVTGMTFSNNLLTITRNDGVTITSSISSFTGLTVNGSLSATTYYGDGSNLTGIASHDTFVTGGTYSNGNAIFTNNTGGTFNVSGFTTPFTGGTVTGNTLFTHNLSANTISATTYLGLPTDITVTGGTYSAGTATFRNNTGGTFNVSGFTTPFTGGTVTGATNFTHGLTANTFSATTYQNLPKIKYVINVAKGGGDYTTINAALNSISGSSENIRYTIKVAPGVYLESEIDLTNKPYVSIVGEAIESTIIEPITQNQNLFKLGFMNELSFMTLQNVGAGYSAILVDDIGNYAQAHKVSFNNCDTNVLVLSSTQDTIFYGEYLDYNGEYSYGTKLVASNGFKAYANIENYYNFPAGSGVTIANHIQGSGATLSVFVGDGIGNGNSGSTNYLIYDYGSLNTTTTTAEGWGYCLRNTNIGGPVRFDIDSLSVVDSIIFDISVEHPDTFGTFNGSSTHTKINTLSPNIYWSFLDSEDGEFEITRKMSVRFEDGTHTDASTLIFEGSTMGLIDGGVITHVSGLTVQISAGFGYLEKTVGNEIYQRVDWGDTTITLSPETQNYLFFNENIILTTQGSAPESTNNIILGRVVTDATSIRFIDATPYNSSHTSNLLSKFNRNALGPVYANGSLVTESATPLHLDVTAGDYYFSENNFLPSGGTDITFTQFVRSGSTWVTNNTNTIVLGFDNNDGVVTPLPSGTYTKHTLYVVGQGLNERYMLVVGQVAYATLVAAEGADLPTPPNYFDGGVAPIASIFVYETDSNIVLIQDIRPVIGFKAAGVSATAIHGNLLGLTADDHPQYLLVDGSRAMNGNLSMGGNAIVSASTVNGVVVEGHAARHKNGGADEIATATPAPSEIPKADTFGKLDSWISNASTTVKGLTRLSSSPANASIPIAVGVNDTRFLNSISGVTNTTPSLVFTNNSGGTTTISNIRLSGVTATTISATTYQNLPTDVRVTGGTYSNGITTFTNNTGGTFTVSGFTTPFTGGTVSGITATTISATTYLGLPTDIRVTGGTYTSGTATFRNNTGGTFTVSGFTNPFTGGTVTGATNFINGLTATTISATTYLGLPIDIYVTDGTFNHGPSVDNNNLILSKSDGNNIIISDFIDVSETNRSEIQVLVNEKLLIKGKTYKIDNCDTALYNNGDNGHNIVYTTIYLKALTENQLSNSGVGVFYTPKYGVYNIFVDGHSYIEEDVVIWGGFVWKCIKNGTYSSIDIFTLTEDWKCLLPFNSSQNYDDRHYNINYDDIMYDFSNDRIIYRNEQNTNIVHTSVDNIDYWVIGRLFYNPIKVFQWGNVYDTRNALGIGNQIIIDSYNENINFNGDYQTNVHFENLSYQEGILVSKSSYQDGLKFFNGSYQSKITIDNGSAQVEIYLDNNSFINGLNIFERSLQKNLYFNSSSKIEKVEINANSIQQNITLNNSSYFNDVTIYRGSEQSNIDFNNGSNQRTITIVNGAYQKYLNFNNGSYQRNIILNDNCIQEQFNFNNLSYQNGVELRTNERASIQSYFNFNNGSYQSDILLDQVYQRNLTFDYGYQTNIETNKSYQDVIYIQNGYQLFFGYHSQNNITIKGYGLDRSSYPMLGDETGLFFINDLPIVKPERLIGKIDNNLVEVDNLYFDGSKWVFTSDVLLNTVSGTTYLGLPIDVFVTGGTYNSGTSTITFRNNTGGTFTVTGLTTGGGGGTFTGGTVTGPTTFTNGLTANTISATTYLGLPTDIRVTGATKSGNVATFTNNTGGTFTLTGLTDTFVTGGTKSGSVVTFTNNTGGTFNVSGFNDVFVTGGTHSNGTTTFTNNTGGTFNVSGYFTGVTFSGTANYIPKFTGSTFTTSRFSDDGFTGAYGDVAGASYVSFIPGANRYLKLVRPQSFMEFVLGNAGIPQNNVINSSNTDGLDIYSTGPLSLYGGSTFEGVSNEGLRVKTDGRLFIPLTPSAGTTSDKILVRTSSGDVKQISTTDITFTGGTVTGATTFTNGLSASTFSATSFNGNIVPSVNNSFTIGNSTNQYSNVFSNVFSSNGTAIFRSANNLVLQVLGGTVEVGRFFNNGNFSIGTSVDSGFKLDVSGNTRIQGGLTANTISATTYQNLPINVNVTGGTYSNGTTVFTNNTGGTFSVSGYTTPFTGGTVTGATNFTGGLSMSGQPVSTYGLIIATTMGYQNLF